MPCQDLEFLLLSVLLQLFWDLNQVARGTIVATMSEEKKKFYKDKHLAYIRKISADTTSFEYLYTQHLRMSGVYWGLCATALLGVDLKTEPSYNGMIQWILSCQDPVTGG